MKVRGILLSSLQPLIVRLKSHRGRGGKPPADWVGDRRGFGNRHGIHGLCDSDHIHIDGKKPDSLKLSGGFRLNSGVNNRRNLNLDGCWI
jgi:hypothetical protein